MNAIYETLTSHLPDDEESTGLTTVQLMAMPMSWKNHFGFVCTPRHNTYQNIQRSGQFSGKVNGIKVKGLACRRVAKRRQKHNFAFIQFRSYGFHINTAHQTGKFVINTVDNTSRPGTDVIT